MNYFPCYAKRNVCINIEKKSPKGSNKLPHSFTTGKKKNAGFQHVGKKIQAGAPERKHLVKSKSALTANV